MFCKKCGKENVDDAQYCASCEFELKKVLSAEESTANSGTIKAQTKHIPKIPLIITCAVFVALFVLYQFAANATKPETIIEKHIAALVNGDYGAVYDSLDIPDGKFTSKELFLSTYMPLPYMPTVYMPVAYMSSANTPSANMPADKITSLTVTQATAKDFKNIEPLPGGRVDAAYTVVYTTQLNPVPSTEILMLTKKGRSFLFFDTYKIEPNNFIVQEYTITAPVGVKVYFDEIELDDAFLSEIETKENHDDSENPSERNVYTIPNTFCGEHIITAKSDFIEDQSQTEYVYTGASAYIGSFKIRADIHSQMHKIAEETLTLFFNGMVAGNSFADISSTLNIAPTQMDAVGKAYDAFGKGSWSGYDGDTVTYSNLSIMSIGDEQKGNSTFTSYTRSPLSYRLGFQVSCDVKAKPHYFLVGKSHSEKYFVMDIDFSYENGELKIYRVR